MVVVFHATLRVLTGTLQNTACRRGPGGWHVADAVGTAEALP